MEWSKKTYPYLKAVGRQVQNQEYTQELRLSEEMPDIGRVLCVWGQCMIRSKEWRGDGIAVSGGIGASVMYLPEDGTSPRVMEAWIPLQTKWSLPQARHNETVRVMGLLQNLDARMLSARKMMLRAGVSVLGEIFEPSEAEISVPSEVPEDVQLLTNIYPAVLPVEGGEKELHFEEELHIPNVQRWLSWRMEPQITEKGVVGGRIVIRGNGQLKYVYMDGEGNIRNGLLEMPFAQFVDLNREYESGASADIMAAVSGLEAEITPEGAKIQCSINAQYLIWERTFLEVVEDAYSPQRSLEIETASIQLPMELEERTEEVMAQCEFRDGMILDTTFYPNFPNQFREGDTINIGLSGMFQILYRSQDGALQAEQESWSEERAVPSAAGTLLNTALENIDVQKNSTNIRMQLDMRTRTNQEIPMITGINIGQIRQPDEKRPTLILRRMDADSLWELAKASGSTVDAIRKANGLTQEPDQGQMLLIPIC